MVTSESTASTELTEPVWGVKTPPHIQDKCDFTLIYWGVVKHDIPLEMNLYCVHRGYLFPVGNKTLHTLMGGYIIGILIGATLFQGRGITIYRVHIISVSFEIYGHLPISPIGRSKRMSLLVTLMEGVKSIYILER